MKKEPTIQCDNMENPSEDNLTSITSKHEESLSRVCEDILYHCSSSYLAIVTVVGIILNTKAICTLSSIIKVRNFKILL